MSKRTLWRKEAEVACIDAGTLDREAATALVPSAGDVVLVPTDALKDADSPRVAGVDQVHARVLAEIVDQLPPILVHRPTMRVIDGMHRLHAVRLARRDHISATYFDGPESEAFLLAVQANIEHGLPLSLGDRKESARRILLSFPHWSDRLIAAKVGLSNKTVGALRRDCPQAAAQPGVRVGRDGRARPLDTTEGRLKAADILSRRPQVSLREIARTAGISVETARNVRERIARQQSPVPAQRPSRPAATDSAGAPDPALPRQQLDLETALASLKKDPTLKYSSEGREMLRWLEARMIRRSEADLVMRAPTHQATKIAAMARAFAEHWYEIAVQLESQATDTFAPAE